MVLEYGNARRGLWDPSAERAGGFERPRCVWHGWVHDWSALVSRE